jgi:Arc/MetJ-type ribon-helix-helix transcriptional regulator
MTNISVRIDPELKERMDKFKDLNWSAVIRNAIKKRIETETERNLAKAVLINERIIKKAPKDFNSSDIIRRFREERYSK